MTTPREIIAEQSDGGPRAPDRIIEALIAAGYHILSDADLAKVEKALRKAEDGAGTLTAKESVKLVPTDWHALSAAIRALKGGRS